MTTASSPVAVLRAQARRCAAMLKKAECGAPVANDPAGKIAAARLTPQVKFAVAMDDKTIVIEMTWKAIRETSQAGITEFILNLMREAQDTIQ